LQLLASSILLVLLLAPAVLAWGAIGHTLTAQLAISLLSSDAKKAVDTCVGKTPLTTVANWADTYRGTSAGSWSAPFHFADVPQQNATSFLYPAFCPNPPNCVVGAVINYTARLQAEATAGKLPSCSFSSASTEPTSLVWLMHLIGDSHQPLHCGYASDLGGNDVKVSFLGTSTNLHTVWDTSLLQWGINTYYNGNTDSLYAALQKQLPTSGVQFKSPPLWANESFQIVRTAVYNFDDPAGSTIQLTQAYAEANFPLVEQRLIAGAIRLADVYNAALDTKTIPLLTATTRNILFAGTAALTAIAVLVWIFHGGRPGADYEPVQST